MSPQVDLNSMQPSQSQAFQSNNNNNNNNHADVAIKTEPSTTPMIENNIATPSPAPNLQSNQLLNANNLLQLNQAAANGVNNGASNSALSQLPFGNLYIQSKHLLIIQ